MSTKNRTKPAAAAAPKSVPTITFKRASVLLNAFNLMDSRNVRVANPDGSHRLEPELYQLGAARFDIMLNKKALEGFILSYNEGQNAVFQEIFGKGKTSVTRVDDPKKFDKFAAICAERADLEMPFELPTRFTRAQLKFDVNEFPQAVYDALITEGVVTD